MPETTTKKATKHYRPRIKEISADADTLGYNYRYLAKVVRGEVYSPRALHAYNQLKASQRKG